MDFRAQLSAFKNKSSNTNSNNDSRGLNNDNGRGSSNNGNVRNHYSNNNYHRNNRQSSPNRGGSYQDGGYGSHRRRNRPHEWGQSPNNYHQGPPSSRRRFHSPPRGPPGYGHGPPDLDGLGELRNYGYRIPRGFPKAPTPDEKAKKSKHLALLAISIDDLPYEDIWKSWCETLSSPMTSSDEVVDEYFISLVCHAKFPERVKSDWLKQRMLTYPPKQGRGNSFLDPEFLTRKPEWGSVEITRAMLDLLQDALKIGSSDNSSDKRFCASRYLIRSPSSFNDSESTPSAIPPVDHFLFISESCLPVVTAPELFSTISDPNISWLNARHRAEEDTPKNKYEDDQFAGINRRIPGQYRWKGDQWVLLSKRHASSIIGMDRPFKRPVHQLWQSFRNINASDEMFFPTALALLGDLRYTKNGYDTQKGRSREEESSSQDGAPSNAAVQKQGNSENDPNSTSADTSSTTPSLTPQNQCIVLKPVTYTDWTEGMRNPATFSNGPKDFSRVGRIARNMGCLVARKFATHIKIPGIPSEEQNITGRISYEEWESIIKEIQEEEKSKAIVEKEENSVVAAPVTPLESATVGTTKPNETQDCITDNNDSDDKGTPSESVQKDVDDKQAKDLNDVDNDDEENQLE